MPTFPDLLPFLLKNIRYPEVTREEGIEGRIVASFIVNADGKISDIEIQRSSGSKQLDAEVIRVIRLMKDWLPGKEKGKPVAVYFRLPVNICLD